MSVSCVLALQKFKIRGGFSQRTKEFFAPSKAQYLAKRTQIHDKDFVRLLRLTRMGNALVSGRRLWVKIMSFETDGCRRHGLGI